VASLSGECDTTGFSRVVFNFNQSPVGGCPSDTTGFSRVVFNFNLSLVGGCPSDTTGFSRVVFNFNLSLIGECPSDAGLAACTARLTLKHPAEGRWYGNRVPGTVG